MPSPDTPGISLYLYESATPVDRTGYLSANKALSWAGSMGQRGTANIGLEVAGSDSFGPVRRQRIDIYENYRLTSTRKRVWAGMVQKIAATYLANDGQCQYALSGVTLEAVFDSILVPASKYTGVLAGDLVAGVFSAVADQIPFPITMGIVEGGSAISDRSFDGSSSAAAAFSQGATDAGFVWYIDPEDLTFNFHAMDSRAAPFTIVDGMALFGTINWTEDASAFRDVQVIQLSPNVAPLSVAVFPGDGSTAQFTLPDTADFVTAAAVVNGTDNVLGEASGTFSGQPSAGDTFTIGGLTYTWATSIDNTVFGQVLIGATDADSCQNAVDAINRGRGVGTRYSAGTYTNPQAYAEQPTGSPALTFLLRAKALGTAGNGIAISKTGTAFSWSAAELDGAEDITGADLRVGPHGSGGYDSTYQPGSDSVNVGIPPADGTSLVVTYRAAGSDKLIIRNGAGIGLGVPSQYGYMQAFGAGTMQSALEQGVSTLTQYSDFTAEVTMQIDKPGIKLAQWVPISITRPAKSATALNGNWICKAISVTLLPGMQKRPEPFGHFRYTITLVNNLASGTYKDTLSKLAQQNQTKQIPTPETSTPPGGAGLGFEPRERELLLKDLTVGNDIADDVVILTPIGALGSPSAHLVMRALRIVAVLKKTIASNLTVRLNKITTLTSPESTTSWTFTVPSTTPVRMPLEFFISGYVFDRDVLTADITASDGSKDKGGVCAVFLEYQ